MGMQNSLHPKLDLPLDLAWELTAAAVQGAREAAQRTLRRPHRRGQRLRPGLDSPLWNALAGAVQAEFRRRGDRARLARFLGLPRQRITEFLRYRQHMPDAERTLLLLLWVQHRRFERSAR